MQTYQQIRCDFQGDIVNVKFFFTEYCCLMQTHFFVHYLNMFSFVQKELRYKNRFHLNKNNNNNQHHL